jgi:hypothetical protein
MSWQDLNNEALAAFSDFVFNYLARLGSFAL